MKKIVHIITKLELGGAQDNTITTCRFLNKEKYKVYLLSGKGGILDNEVKDLNTIFIKELVREINPFYDFITLFKIYKILKKISPDIVHTHSSKAGILGRWASYFLKISSKKDLKIIHTFHGFGFTPSQGFFIRNFFVFLEKVTGKISDVLIFVSEENLKKAKKLKIGDFKKYNLIHSGIHLDRFDIEVDVDKKKEEFGIEKDFFVVGMVACFKKQKNVLTFIDVAKEIKKEFEKVKFVIVGDGVLRKEIEKKIKEYSLKDSFILTGWRRDVNEIIKIFDVSVLTSLWEGLPRFIIESFYCGIPVVASKVDGNIDVVKDGENGFLIEPFDVNGYREKILYLLRNPDVRKKMGERGREIVNGDFDIRVMVKRIEDLYDGL